MKLSIKTKLAGAFGLVISKSMAAGGVAYVKMTSIDETYSNLIELDAKRMILVENMKENLLKGLCRCVRCDQHLVGGDVRPVPRHRMWAAPEREG